LTGLGHPKERKSADCLEPVDDQGYNKAALGMAKEGPPYYRGAL